MSNTHQPYNTPNTAVGYHVPAVPDPGTAAYQHWLDDAAQMGLMLFRMRNDSKRQYLLSQQARPPPAASLPPHARPTLPAPPRPPTPVPGQRPTPPSSSGPTTPVVGSFAPTLEGILPSTACQSCYYVPNHHVEPHGDTRPQYREYAACLRTPDVGELAR